MKRWKIRYCTDSNSSTRFSVHRGRTAKEAEQKFVRMMKTMNLTEWNIEIFEIIEIN